MVYKKGDYIVLDEFSLDNDWVVDKNAIMKIIGIDQNMCVYILDKDYFNNVPNKYYETPNNNLLGWSGATQNKECLRLQKLERILNEK